MGSSGAGDLDSILRILPASPSRRDYGIRSPARSRSPVRLDGDQSCPQSPWRHVPSGSDFEAFRYYESNPPPLVLGSSYYSGPLPAAPSTPGRSAQVPSYSGPLPSSSGPLPSFTAATTDSFEFATWARMYHQHANESNSVPGSPDGDSGSSHESSFRDSAKGDGKQSETASVHYLPAASTPARMEFSARAGMHGRVGSRSGELGRSEDSVAMQKTLVSRGYKSGELSGLDIAATFGGLDVVRQQRWENLNKEASPCESEPMLTIPFKWEEASKSRSRSRSPSVTSKKSVKSAPIVAGVGDFSFGSSHTKSSAEGAESVNGSEASEAVSVASKPVSEAATTTTTPVAKPPKKASAVHSAVPFKWEDAPGKPKLGDAKATTETKTPALQLPPRLASASVKRGSWSTSTPSMPSTARSHSRNNSSASLRTRPTKTTQTSPDSSTSSKHSRRSLPELKSKSSRKASAQPSPAPAPVPTPSPAAAPTPSPEPEPVSAPTPIPPSPQAPRHTLGPNFLSGPLDASAKLPVESATASKSGPISQLGFPQHDFFSVRSPTSTLQGPGSSSLSSSQPSSSKSPSVTYSHSGTSAESLEHWSDADQSIHGHDTSDPESSTTTQRKRSSSRSKPPLSPIPASSNLDKTPAEDESSMDPPTRLPYKMPETTNTCQDIVVAKPASRRSNSRCFDLPMFVKSRGSDQEDEHVFAPSNSMENGYRSPTYKAALDLLSPSPSVTPATSKARSMKLGSTSPRHFVEGLCNSLRHSFQKISKRSSKSTKPVEDDSFMKRHPSLGL